MNFNSAIESTILFLKKNWKKILVVFLIGFVAIIFIILASIYFTNLNLAKKRARLIDYLNNNFKSHNEYGDSFSKIIDGVDPNTVLVSGGTGKSKTMYVTLYNEEIELIDLNKTSTVYEELDITYSISLDKFYVNYNYISDIYNVENNFFYDNKTNNNNCEDKGIIDCKELVEKVIAFNKSILEIENEMGTKFNQNNN